MSGTDANLEAKLKRNIVKYAWFKVFTKRVYLPLIAIQLVNVGKVTIEEIAVIAIITAVVSVLLQMPAGYLADKIGNRFAIILGSSIAAASPLLYVFLPNFAGGLTASLLFFGGYAFITGALEAFMHDTLKALKRENDYSKVMGRSQSYGLIGNVVLITLIPATYAIDHTLPFLIGFVSQLIMVWLAISFIYPNNETDAPVKNPFNAVRSIVSLENIALFIFAGFTTGIAFRGGEFKELLFQDIGIAVALFGALAALASLVGAVMGLFVHVFDKIKPLAFYLIDLLFMAACLIVAGLTDNIVISVIAFTLFAGYGRVRLIIFQAKLLADIKHAYKATLLSALNLFTIIGEVSAVSILAALIGDGGYLVGYFFFGLSALGIGLILWFVMYLERRIRL